ncbi:type 1 fimbrial protein [Pantoea sp. Bo_2]|uniref:Type 1 fimbrial protein n=1 Tax=Candidatus Pantoea gossypiicola TaxID=2608008 RepID=A0AB34CKM5_9GAMM|nr:MULTISPECIES: type 1 fimbrial protein [Pantoea]KAA5931675.1 type 1 fimbrial protein [Pantoea sp. VH_8]KAA5936810.1 type 1 fimbrial protein [Pantoea sp. VH_4]KAA5948366.1 type 1 fimbrial protein [Pantoea sp. VH_3]KAA5953636.1 type 1 fimbrial protein [Pantoea sp. VH_25]KAA5956529.1 type 1 fimbrial protein [Pantoea sp. VH_24]
MKFLLTTCLSLLLMALAGPARADSQSGTIIFRGAITNGSCNMNIGQNPVVFDCYDPARGKAVVTTADVMNPESLTGLPVEVKMHWFNPEKSKGIIEVSYL